MVHRAVHRRIPQPAGGELAAVYSTNRHVRSGLRWRGARDDRAVLDRRGRSWNLRARILRAEPTMLRRLEPDGVRYLRTFQRGGSEVDSATIYGLPIDERIAIRDGHGVHVMGIHEIDVVDVGRVQNVYVADKRVVDVDHSDETPPAGEPGEERLTKAQREPADPTAPAKSGAETKASAEKADKGWAKHRRTKEGTRAPAPCAANECPAAIMEGRKAPRRIVNPSPAPGADPVPVAVAVRSPARGDLGGIPNMSVLRLIAPSAVIIQVAVADHVARNVVRGDRVVFL